MKTFFIQVEIKPTKGNPKTSTIREAFAHVWVQEKNNINALQEAVHHLSKVFWKVSEVLYVQEVTPEIVEDMDSAERHHYQHALAHGICVGYIGLPEEDHLAEDSA